MASYGSLPFNEAIDFFRQKTNMPSERWTDVWRTQHNNAFMVAGATKTELLADLRQMVDSAIAEGQSLKAFKSQFKHLVKKHGWDHTGNAAWRANIIYSTNVRQSYNAGRYAQLQNFPYWRYAHGDSRFPRPHHASKDKLILPKESPFWRVWFPQNGWGCKCKVYGETKRSLERRGHTLSDEPIIETIEWTDKATGEVHYVPQGIDPGFDYSPGHRSQADTLKQQQATRPPLRERLPERQVPTAFSTNKQADVHGLNRVFDDVAARQPQLKKLGAFIQKYDIKTLLLRPSDMARGTSNISALREPIADYLGIDVAKADSYWPVPKSMVNTANGYTSKRWKHVVVKAKTGISFSKVVSPDHIIDAIEAAILSAKEGKKMWSLSSIVRRYTESGDHGGAFVTWVHEMGHQIHYRAMEKGIDHPAEATGITRYSLTNWMEWHAEHFAAWALNRESLVTHHPEVATYFDQLIETLLDE